MAKMRKPFVSRKRRRELEESRARRENLMQVQEDQRKAQIANAASVQEEKRPVMLPSTATVGEFSTLLDIPVVRVIAQLMKSGIMAAINDRVDFDTMAIIADELGFVPSEQSKTEEVEIPVMPTSSPATEGVERPPIVTIMGHVDHGKTSLLDKIRRTNVVAGEFGGITQHIGAYQAEVTYEERDRLITFLDTPGHEAFTALRSHGAQVTDIVVLVVAADDGVKPQTIEALNHAKSASVPIIVAITKVDLPSANIERVKQQLTEHGLIPEEWGGETIMTPVSSVSGEGIHQLLEFIILTADLRNYQADPNLSAQGVVIESHQEVGLGPVATVLVQNGTLRVGDVLVVGQTYAKVRSMLNFTGERIVSAGPSVPVRIAGWQAIPGFGESFATVKNEKQARELTQRFASTQARRGISDISQAIAEGRTDTLKIILKADAQGSIEALHASISKLQEPGVKPLIIHSGIGDITLTDIQLAAASGAVVFGFHVIIPPQIKKAAENQGVTVSTFKIIYDLLNQIELTLKGLIRIEKVKIERGKLRVKKIFRTGKDAQILGGEIIQGVALNKSFVTLLRDDEKRADGKVISLQKGPEVVEELEAGQDCGLSVTIHEKIQPGDILVFMTEEEKVVETLE